MSGKFAVLVAHTIAVLEDKNMTVEGLILLIRHMHGYESDGNKLIKELKSLKKENIDEAMKIMSHYWSFFDHDLLSGIIESCGSPELKLEYDEYVGQFMQYCKQRFYEVPPSSEEKGRGRPRNVKIVLDESFDIRLEDRKAVTEKLSCLFDTSVRLIGFIDPKERVEEVDKESGQPPPLSNSES